MHWIIFNDTNDLDSIVRGKYLTKYFPKIDRYISIYQKEIYQISDCLKIRNTKINGTIFR